jgi:double-strand break repair protein MRE11
VNDVVQFYQKRKSAATRRVGGVNDEAGAAISHLTALDTVRVEQLVRDFLAAQSLTILPQNSFGDAVSQFVDKDDKHAMEMFVNESLENQAQHLLALDYDVAMEGEDDDGHQE